VVSVAATTENAHDSSSGTPRAISASRTALGAASALRGRAERPEEFNRAVTDLLAKVG